MIRVAETTRRRIVSAARTLGLLFAVASAVNYPWELAQAPLYEWPGEPRNALWHCFVAALGDGVLVLLIFAAGLIALRRPDWFEKPGLEGYLVMLTAGASVAIAVEWTALHALLRWSYSDPMPRMPVLNVGLVPVAQMLILPPAIFRLAAAISKWMR